MSLVINNLTFGYNENVDVFNNVSVEISQGIVLGVLGPNGTGKTTFIKCINNILRPKSGEVLYNGENIRSYSSKQMAQLIAYVPQYNNSFFAMNVIDVVFMGRLAYSDRNYSENDKKVVFEILEKMHLTDFAFKNIKEMSGGERQRVFIARALAQQPRIIILDEPTSSLDLNNQLFILETLTEIAKRDNITIMMSIHDLNLAAMFCEKILMLKNGSIFAYGATNEVIKEEYVNEMYNVKTKISLEDGYKHVRLLRC